MEPAIAAEGEEVLLLAHKLPETFRHVEWHKGKIKNTNKIVTLKKNPENIINGPAYSGRETIYSNGSLLIRNLTVGDTGNYWMQVITMSFDLKFGKGELRVYEPLSKPNITANNSRPLEQESVVLTCEPLSPHTTYRWFNNTQSVEPSARLQLSMDNRTLTVLHVIRQDTGSYECETSNPVSVHRSDPVNLTVLYGPDPLIIYPSKRNYRRGENLSLSCLTASYPPAQFSWFMEKKPLGSTQNLSIPNLSLNDSGSYSCLASNSFTHINRTIVINITVSAGRGAVPVGIIVGTVFGVLVGVGLVAALGYFLFRRRSKRNQGHNDHVEQMTLTNSPGPGAPSSSAAQTPRPFQSPAEDSNETPRPFQSPAEDSNETPRPFQRPAEDSNKPPLPDRSPADHVYKTPRPFQRPAEDSNKILLPYRSPFEDSYETLLTPD